MAIKNNLNETYDYLNYLEKETVNSDNFENNYNYLLNGSNIAPNANFNIEKAEYKNILYYYNNLSYNSINYKNTVYNPHFPNFNSDVLIYLTMWQYWWWFWFIFLSAFYYVYLIKIIFNRQKKFNPRINTSIKSHGKWGDLIVGAIPVYWCLNILVNSNFLLKTLEWQTETNVFTVRIKGKQWYWIYKIDVFQIDNLLKISKNVGRNNIMHEPNYNNINKISNYFIGRSWYNYYINQHKDDLFTSNKNKILGVKKNILNKIMITQAILSNKSHRLFSIFNEPSVNEVDENFWKQSIYDDDRLTFNVKTANAYEIYNKHIGTDNSNSYNSFKKTSYDPIWKKNLNRQKRYMFNRNFYKYNVFDFISDKNTSKKVTWLNFTQKVMPMYTHFYNDFIIGEIKNRGKFVKNEFNYLNCWVSKVRKQPLLNEFYKYKNLNNRINKNNLNKKKYFSYNSFLNNFKFKRYLKNIKNNIIYLEKTLYKFKLNFKFKKSFYVIFNNKKKKFKSLNFINLYFKYNSGYKIMYSFFDKMHKKLLKSNKVLIKKCDTDMCYEIEINVNEMNKKLEKFKNNFISYGIVKKLKKPYPMLTPKKFIWLYYNFYNKEVIKCRLKSGCSKFKPVWYDWFFKQNYNAVKNYQHIYTHAVIYYYSVSEYKFNLDNIYINNLYRFINNKILSYAIIKIRGNILKIRMNVPGLIEGLPKKEILKKKDKIISVFNNSSIISSMFSGSRIRPTLFFRNLNDSDLNAFNKPTPNPKDYKFSAQKLLIEHNTLFRVIKAYKRIFYFFKLKNKMFIRFNPALRYGYQGVSKLALTVKNYTFINRLQWKKFIITKNLMDLFSIFKIVSYYKKFIIKPDLLYYVKIINTGLDPSSKSQKPYGDNNLYLKYILPRFKLRSLNRFYRINKKFIFKKTKIDMTRFKFKKIKKSKTFNLDFNKLSKRYRKLSSFFIKDVFKKFIEKLNFFFFLKKNNYRYEYCISYKKNYHFLSRERYMLYFLNYFRNLKYKVSTNLYVLINDFNFKKDYFSFFNRFNKKKVHVYSNVVYFKDILKKKFIYKHLNESETFFLKKKYFFKNKKKFFLNFKKKFYFKTGKKIKILKFHEQNMYNFKNLFKNLKFFFFTSKIQNYIDFFKSYYILTKARNKMGNEYFYLNCDNFKISFSYSNNSFKPYPNNMYFIIKQTRPNVYTKSSSGNTKIRLDSFYKFNKNGNMHLDFQKQSKVFLDMSKRLTTTNFALVLPANLNLTTITNSYDVIHSWFIPGIGIKMDCVPGRSTHHTFYFDIYGLFLGQCAEVCGRFHHHMPIRIALTHFDIFMLWVNNFLLYFIVDDHLKKSNS